MEDIVKRMNELAGTISIDPNPDNLSAETLAKVNELRAKRNALNDQASEVQKEIDELIMNENHFDELAFKYLKISYEYDDITIYCGPVMDITRLYSRSCRISVRKSLTIYKCENDDMAIKLYTNDEIELSNYDSEKFGKRRTHYEEITRDEFDSIIVSTTEKFLNS